MYAPETQLQHTTALVIAAECLPVRGQFKLCLKVRQFLWEEDLARNATSVQIVCNKENVEIKILNIREL